MTQETVNYRPGGNSWSTTVTRTVTWGGSLFADWPADGAFVAGGDGVDQDCDGMDKPPEDTAATSDTAAPDSDGDSSAPGDDSAATEDSAAEAPDPGSDTAAANGTSSGGSGSGCTAMPSGPPMSAAWMIGAVALLLKRRRVPVAPLEPDVPTRLAVAGD